MPHIQKNIRHNWKADLKNPIERNKIYYIDKGYNLDDLNEKGKPIRGLVSFQCEKKLWRDFHREVKSKHGNYKVSTMLEILIRRYLKGTFHTEDWKF